MVMPANQADILEMEEDLSTLPEILNGHSSQDAKILRRDHLKRLEQKREEIITIKKDLIKDLNNNESQQLDKKNVLAELKEEEERAERLRGIYAKCSVNSETATAENARLEISNKILKIKQKHEIKKAEKMAAVLKRKEVLNKELANLEREAEQNTLTIQGKRGAISDKEERIELLRQKWEDVHAQSIPDNSEICPTCGKPFLPEEIEKSKAKFNENKAKSLDKINLEGQRMAKDLNKEKEEIEGEAKALDEIKKGIKNIETQTKDLEEEIVYIQSQKIESGEYSNLLQNKEKLKEKLKGLEANPDITEKKEKLKEEIEKIEQKSIEIRDNLSTLKEEQKKKEKIKALKEQQKNLSEKIELKEEELSLIKKYLEIEAGLLEGKINALFNDVKWRMFNKLENGDLKQACFATYKGVPYLTNLNKGHKVKVDLDIISTLSKAYDTYLPVFVDNAESVTTLPDIENQIIRLVKPDIEDHQDLERYYSSLKLKKAED